MRRRCSICNELEIFRKNLQQDQKVKVLHKNTWISAIIVTIIKDTILLESSEEDIFNIRFDINQIFPNDIRH